MMEKRWLNFKKALDGVVNNENLAFIQTADTYVMRFINQVAATEKQQKLLKNIAIILLVENESFEEMAHYLPFIFPFEQLEEAIKNHQSVKEALEAFEVSSIESQIVHFAQKNEVPDSIIEFMRKNPSTLDALLYTLGLAYVANEDSSKFADVRLDIFDLYRSSFASIHYKLPKNLFMTTDTEAIEQYILIQESLPSNTVLHLAFSIVIQQPIPSLAEGNRMIASMYERIRLLFIQLSPILEKGSVMSYVSN